MMINTNYVATAMDIAREAGTLLLRYEQRQRVVEEKNSDYDFVTDADRASQALIERRLRQTFPGHRFVGEEDGKADRQVAEMLMDPDSYCWVADPLDGTMNYIKRLHGYAVSLALVHGGKILCGATYMPCENEMFSAEAGSGAFLNGQRLCVSDSSCLHSAFTTTGVPPVNMDDRARMVDWIRRVSMQTLNLRIIGCATRAIAYVAAGRFDAYWELGPHPWDVAAGRLLISEAGGAQSTLTGTPYRFGDNGIVVDNGRIHEGLITLLQALPYQKGGQRALK